MKKELRGRKTSSYLLRYVPDIENIITSHRFDKEMDEDAKALNNEFGFDISTASNIEDCSDAIKRNILGMYNDDITPSVMFLYSFIYWFQRSSKVLNIKGHFEKRTKLLDFGVVLNQETIDSVDVLLTQEYDRDDVDEYILHAQYKLLSIVKKHIVLKDNIESFLQFEKIIVAVINNSRYLCLINDKLEVDMYFLMQWEYYPVDKAFRDVVDKFNSELNRKTYMELKGNEYFYYDKIKKAEVSFSSIKRLPIMTDGKLRTVHVANEPIDKATLIYLSKRLNKEFHISYPNRDKIMELAFNLIDSLPRLDNYTIFKFDFKDFFDSVEIRSVYKKFIEHSNLYSCEKELLLKLARKYKYCVQGLPVSNALIEIISRDFDDRIKAAFSTYGLVFYKRYVDDCILIFNHKLERSIVEEQIERCRVSTFGKKVLLSSTKTSYQTKLDGDETFDYLGYSFNRCYWDKSKSHYYYKFGIASKKIEKYKKQLDAMFDAYEDDLNDRLLLRRIQYYNSRIVFYNYYGSKYVNKSTWDVRGIINSYKMLRRYIIYDNNMRAKNTHNKKPYRISKETYFFLRYYVKEKRDALLCIPQYLQGKGCDDHTLWNGFLKNKSIVFQPNIGWSNDLLNKRLIEVGVVPWNKSYYEKTRDYYSTILKT